MIDKAKKTSIQVVVTELPEFVRVERQICNKCRTKFFPKIRVLDGLIILPKHCPNRSCNSPNWNKPERHYFLRGKDVLGKGTHGMSRVKNRKVSNQKDNEITSI